jgi:phage major head subunit gpT-like protein
MSSSHGGLYQRLDSRAIVGRFYRRYEEDANRIWANRVMWLNPDANQETETYRFLGASPMLREWVGARQAKQLELFEFQIKHIEFEATLAFARADMRRDKTGQINIRIGDLANRAGDHWNKLLTNLRVANGTAYDGQAFYSATHAIGASGTLVNLLAAAQVPALNVVTAAAPTKTEMVNIIIGMIQHAYTMKDEQGEPINGTARHWDLQVPANMIGVAVAATKSERISGGESNTLLAQNWTVEPVVNPRLTSTTEIYLDRTDAEIKPFVGQEERPLSIEILGEGSDHSFKHKEHLFGVEAIRNVGYGEWAYSFKGTLS